MNVMRMVIESKKNELCNNKKGKELLEVYEWSGVIGELYESICEMVSRERSNGRGLEWIVLKEYCK